MRKQQTPYEPYFLVPAAPWMKQAACRQYPYFWWHLEKKDDAAHNRLNERALRICRTSCPVLKDCLKQTHDWIDQGRRPLGVIMAGIRWGSPKNPLAKPSFRPCVCCGAEIPPWIRVSVTRCSSCVKQGVST